MFIELVMLSNDLILCRPFLLLPSLFPNIRVFARELTLHTRWPKDWSFIFSNSPSIQGWFPLGLTGWISLSQETQGTRVRIAKLKPSLWSPIQKLPKGPRDSYKKKAVKKVNPEIWMTGVFDAWHELLLGPRWEPRHECGEWAQARGLINARWGSGEVSGVIHIIEVPKHPDLCRGSTLGNILRISTCGGKGAGPDRGRILTLEAAPMKSIILALQSCPSGGNGTGLQGSPRARGQPQGTAVSHGNSSFWLRQYWGGFSQRPAAVWGSVWGVHAEPQGLALAGIARVLNRQRLEVPEQ